MYEEAAAALGCKNDDDKKGYDKALESLTSKFIRYECAMYTMKWMEIYS